MAKYTREEIIERLKALKEGDVLVGVVDSEEFMSGNAYTVHADDDGDLFIVNERFSAMFLSLGGDYQRPVFERISNGLLDFADALPAPAAPATPYVRITKMFPTAFDRTTLELVVDAAGLAAVQALEQRYNNAEELRELERQRDEIDRRIAELTTEGAVG